MIHQAIPDLDSNIKKVILYYIDITSEEEIRKFIAEDDSTTVEIELRDLKTILDDVVIGDYAKFHTEEIHEDLFGGWQVMIDTFVSDRVLQKITDFNNKARIERFCQKAIQANRDAARMVWNRLNFSVLTVLPPMVSGTLTAKSKLIKTGLSFAMVKKTRNSGVARFAARRNLCD